VVLGSKTPINVFFFGDSICFGQGISIHLGWVARMSARLHTLSEVYGHSITVTNASINGNTTRQALERMAYDVLSHGVDFMILQFGLNDCNYWVTDKGVPRVTPKAFEANLEEILQRATTFGARRIIMNTNHPTGRNKEIMKFTSITYDQSNHHYNEIIRKVASEHKKSVILNDIEKLFLEHIGREPSKLADLLLPDQIHPSIAGHDLYFQSISPILEKIFDEQLRTKELV